MRTFYVVCNQNLRQHRIWKGMKRIWKVQSSLTLHMVQSASHNLKNLIREFFFLSIVSFQRLVFPFLSKIVAPTPSITILYSNVQKKDCISPQLSMDRGSFLLRRYQQILEMSHCSNWLTSPGLMKLMWAGERTSRIQPLAWLVNITPKHLGIGAIQFFRVKWGHHEEVWSSRKDAHQWQNHFTTRA